MTGVALVTGGAGFLGRHLVEALRQRARPVRVLDPAAIDAAPAGVEVCRASILDAAALTAALEGVDQVYHLAALAHLWARDPGDFDRLNREATLELLSALRARRGVRLLHTSTEVILRDWRDPGRAPLTESEPLPTMDAMPGPYTRSKLAAETAVRTAIADGVDGVIVYPTVPIGPGDRNLTAPAAMIRAFASAPPPAFMDCTLNLVDVRAVAQGMIAAMERGVRGGRYLLAGEDVPMATLLARLGAITGRHMPRRRVPWRLALVTGWCSEWLARWHGRRPLASVEGVRLARHDWIVSNARARRELQWTPGDLDSALRSAVADLLDVRAAGP